MSTVHNNTTKMNIISNLLWKFAERSGSQVITFIVQIILARLLLPEEFGMIAMVLVFIAIGDVLVTSGFGSALIQKKDTDNLDYSSIFIFSIIFSLLLYIIIFTTAPVVANFYGYKILKPVMRIIGLRVVFNSINSVQQAYVAKNMIFKKFFYSTISGTLISAVIGIAMAYFGYGVWALVAQQMLNISINTIVLFLIIEWKPELQFSAKRVKNLFSFGWKLLLAGLLNTLSNQIRHLVIGKIYTPSDLAFYDRGLKLPTIIMTNVNTSISAVMYPVVSNEQDNIERLKMLTRKSIRLSSYLIFPILIGVIVMAEPLVKVLLTDKWLPCVPYLRIGCYIHAVTIMQISIQNAILAKGKSDIFLIMDIVSKTLGFTLLFCVMKLGVMVIALTAIVTGTFNVFMKAYVSRRLLGYRYREHIADNGPILLISIVMGIIIYLVNNINLTSFVTLTIQIPLGIFVYFTLSYFFNREGLDYFISIIKTINGRRSIV